MNSEILRSSLGKRSMGTEDSKCLADCVVETGKDSWHVTGCRWLFCV